MGLLDLLGLGGGQQYGAAQNPAPVGMGGLLGGLFGGGANSASANSGGGFLGLLGGGGGDLYGDTLTPQQKRAIAGRRLGGFAQAVSPMLGYSLDPGKVGSPLQALTAGIGGMGDAGDAAALSALRAGQLGLQSENLRSQLPFRRAAEQMLQRLYGGASGQTPSATQGLLPAQQPDAGGGGMPQSGATTASDPRGVVPLIREAAIRYGHDPDVAVKVAQSEGLGTFLGDGGKSGSAFQLYTGGGLGNEFQKDTGLNPLDPKNEPAAIDWAMRNLSRTGWTPYHGARGVGVGPRDGIDIGTPGNLPAVPNFAGMMTGNQAPSYAPASQPQRPVQLAQAGPIGPGLLGGSVQPGASNGNVDAGALQTPNPIEQFVAQIQAENKSRSAPAGGILGGGGVPGLPRPQPAPAQAAGVPGVPSAGIDPKMLAFGGAAAQLGGLPDVFKPLEQFYYNSPAYKGQIAGTEEQAKRSVGLPFVGPEAQAKAQGERSVTEQSDIRIAEAHAKMERETNRQKMRDEVNPYGFGPGTGGAPGAGAVSPVVSGNGPGYTEPAPTPRGTAIPPVSVASPIIGSPAYLKERQTGKGGWSDTENGWAKAQQTNAEDEQTVKTIANVFKSYGTGSFAGFYSDLKARAKGLGIPDSMIPDGNDPAAAQIASKMIFQRMVGRMRGIDSNPTGWQIKEMVNNWASTDTQPEANVAMLSQTLGVVRQTNALASDWAQAKRYGWVDPQDFERSWFAMPQNSLGSFVEKASQEIGPFKGMPGAGGTSNAGHGVPAAPAVGTVRDGHRFNGGNPADPNSWQRVQ